MSTEENNKEAEEKVSEGDVTMAAMPSLSAMQGVDQNYHYVPVLLTLLGEASPQRVVVESPELIIGRSKDVDISLGDNTASRQHAKIVYTNISQENQKPQIFLYDLKSRNGVFVNGVQVNQHIPLRDNARIVIGDIQLGFYMVKIPKKVDPSQRSSSQVQAAQDSAGSQSNVAAASSSQIGTQGGVSKRLAIIESDFEAGSDLRERLEETKRYTAIVYRNVDNAIKNAASTQPQMILLDADMEGPGSCLDICEKLKIEDATKNIPIIVLFKVFDPTLVRSSLKAGAQSYLIKPIDNLSQLTNRIDIHMNINRMMPTPGN
jgi:pSer/pThr/pTyr-binding forkhead associated (FHA) protein